jgi:ketosteroid isomerase-like protein
MRPIDVMERYLAAMRSGDRETGYGFYAEDIVAFVPGRSALAGRREGRDAVIDYISTAVAMASRGVELEVLDVLAGEEHVALMVRERLSGEHGDLDMLRTNVYRVRDGRIVEIRVFESDQYAVDAWFDGAG